MDPNYSVLGPKDLPTFRLCTSSCQEDFPHSRSQMSVAMKASILLYSRSHVFRGFFVEEFEAGRGRV
jgi:hypothetical protein